jgi:hypothetical protein
MEVVSLKSVFKEFDRRNRNAMWLTYHDLYATISQSYQKFHGVLEPAFAHLVHHMLIPELGTGGLVDAAWR